MLHLNFTQIFLSTMSMEDERVNSYMDEQEEGTPFDVTQGQSRFSLWNGICPYLLAYPLVY